MKKLLISSSVIAMAVSAPALAQNGLVASSPPSTAPGADEQSGLADIIVTAQKRAENSQKAPLAITSLSADTLAAAHVMGATDLQRVVPSLHAEVGGGVGDAGGANTLFTIRGLGASATGPQGSSGVAAHFDGVYQQGGLTNSEFFDLERIEVAPGPQGTLYGRSAAAGAINVIPNKPLLGQFHMAGSLQAGNYSAFTEQAMINAPIGDDMAVRVALQKQDHDGYYSNGYDALHAFSARAQILFKPDDRLTVRVLGSYTQLRGRGAGNVNVGNDPAFLAAAAIIPTLNDPDLRDRSVSQSCFVNATIQFNCFQHIHIDKKFVEGEINYDFGGATLTLLPAYIVTDRSITNSNVPVPLSGFNQVPYNNKQFNFEARLASSAGSKLKWVLGGNYYKNTVYTHVDQFINFIVPAPIALPTPPFPPKTAVQGIAASHSFQDQNSHQQSYAAFGQATYAVLDKVRLTVGGRYNHDTSYDAQTLGNLSNLIYVYSGFAPLNGKVLRNLLVTPANPTGAPVITPLQTGSAKFNAFTYRVAVDADVGPRSIVYASVGSGYKPGGLNDGGPTSSTTPASPLAPQQFFGPERVTHYEIGSKNRFVDNRLQVNVAAYYDDYKHYQNGQTQVVNPLAFGALGFVVTNAGSARIYGTELDVKFQLTPHDEFDFSVNYLHARFRNYIAPAYLGTTGPVAAIDFSGFALPNAPEFSGNISYRHTFELGKSGQLVASAYTHLSEGYWTYFAEASGTHQGSYSNTTLDLTWLTPWRGIRVSAFVNNLEDHDIKVFGTAIGGISSVGLAPPRTYGGSVSFNF